MEDTQLSLKSLSISTQLTVLGRSPEKQHGFVNPPLFKGSTIIHRSVKDLEDHRGRVHYGTAGSPTIANLEKAWAALTGAAGTVLSPSGLGAISLTLFSFSKSGDHILVTDSIYGPTRSFCDGLLKKFGVETEYYDPSIGSGIEELIRPNTTVIFMESPGSLTMEVQDVPGIVGIAKSHAITTILDNTWATPLYFPAHKYGVDVTVEAGTKYLGGHSDILIGLASANESCWPTLRATYDAMAMLPGADDCLLALRGMRTLNIRLKDTEAKALDLAKWLRNRYEIQKVLHPALVECPGHEFWKRDYKGSTGLFSIVLKKEYTRNDLEAMLDGMSIFKIGYSWGGYESLVIPASNLTQRRVLEWSPLEQVVRLQIGLEELVDLRNDLEAGFKRLTASNVKDKKTND